MKQRTKSQNGKRSRDKGERFMREVVNQMQAAGVGCCKRSQYRGASKDGCDIQDTDWWIECKVGSARYLSDDAVRRMHDAAETEEVRHREADCYRSPVVLLWRRDRGVAQVTIRLRDLERDTEQDDALTGSGPIVTLRFADWLGLVKP